MSNRARAATAAFIFLAASSVAVQAEQSQSGQTRTKEVASTKAQHKSMEELQKASEKLRDALAVLEREQPGPNRDQALKAARKALEDTQQAMAQLPPEWKAVGGRKKAPSVGSTGGRPTPAEA